MKNRNRKGFTLIEMIIVIVIVSILGAVAYLGARAIIDRSARSSVEAPAGSFRDALSGIAGFGSADYTVNGNAGGATDTDPRKSVYLLELLDKEESIPNKTVATASLSASNLRVLVFNGIPGSSSHWTRLTCDTASSIPCMHNPGGFDNDLASHIVTDTHGALPGVYVSGGTSGVLQCVMFHANGKTVYLGWPTAYAPTNARIYAQTAPTISPDITRACGAAGLSTSDELTVTAGAVTYYDLGQTSAVTDSSWES